MRVVHVNYDAAATGGASIAMLRLHEAMLDNGIDSHIVCKVRAEARNSVAIKINPLRKLLILMGKVYTKIVSGSCHSSGLFSTGMAKVVNKLKPDMVILHWLQSDTIAIRELRQIRSQIFWFHHDLWPIRGLTACEWFPIPHNLKWLDKLSQAAKVRNVRMLYGKLVPVCSSKWVASEIRRSRVFKGYEPKIIPLPLDSVFCIGHRKPANKFRILFGARGGLDAGLKGGDRLIAAINLIPPAERDDMELVVFGGQKSKYNMHGIQITDVGRCEGEDLAQLYRDADVFAFPSRQETFGQTKLEALSCGTPVVAFDETACAEGIIHKINGWIAKSDDLRDYCDGIRWIYSLWKAGCPLRIRGGDNQYMGKRVIEAWLNVYKNSLSVKTERTID